MFKYIEGLHFPLFVSKREYVEIIGNDVATELEGCICSTITIRKNKEMFLEGLFDRALLICKHLFLDKNPHMNLDKHLPYADDMVEDKEESSKLKYVVLILVYGILSYRKGNTKAVSVFNKMLLRWLDNELTNVADGYKSEPADMLKSVKDLVKEDMRLVPMDMSPTGLKEISEGSIKKYFDAYDPSFPKKYNAECLLKVCKNKEEQMKMYEILISLYPELGPTVTENAICYDSTSLDYYEIEDGTFCNFITLGALYECNALECNTVEEHDAEGGVQNGSLQNQAVVENTTPQQEQLNTNREKETLVGYMQNKLSGIEWVEPATTEKVNRFLKLLFLPEDSQDSINADKLWSIHVNRRVKLNSKEKVTLQNILGYLKRKGIVPDNIYGAPRLNEAVFGDKTSCCNINKGEKEDSDNPFHEVLHYFDKCYTCVN